MPCVGRFRPRSQDGCAFGVAPPSPPPQAGLGLKHQHAGHAAAVRSTGDSHVSATPPEPRPSSVRSMGVATRVRARAQRAFSTFHAEAPVVRATILSSVAICLAPAIGRGMGCLFVRVVLVERDRKPAVAERPRGWPGPGELAADGLVGAPSLACAAGEQGHRLRTCADVAPRWGHFGSAQAPRHLVPLGRCFPTCMARAPPWEPESRAGELQAWSKLFGSPIRIGVPGVKVDAVMAFLGPRPCRDRPGAVGHRMGWLPPSSGEFSGSLRPLP